LRDQIRRFRFRLTSALVVSRRKMKIACRDYPAHEQFAQDLADVRVIAKFAKERGVPKLTLEVNW
jgi:hypothetical protein